MPIYYIKNKKNKQEYLRVFTCLQQESISQVTFIYIALYTIQIVSKKLYSVKQKNICADNARAQ